MLFPIFVAVCITLFHVGSTTKCNNSTKETVRVGVLKALPSLLVLSFLVFPMVSSVAFQAFSCEEFDGGKAFLRADFAVECQTPEHSNARVLALVAILFYPIGVTLLYAGLFRKAKRAILDDKPTALSSALDFLTLDFEKQWFMWVSLHKSKTLPSNPIR